MQSLNNILSNINTIIANNIADYDAVFHGLSVLHTQDGQTYPMTKIAAREGIKISPVDTAGLIFYHRVIDHDVDEVGGKGIANYYFHNYTMKLVAVGHRNTLGIDFDNDDQANTIMNILGSNKPDGAVLQVTGRGEIDKSDVLSAEYSGNTRILTKVIDLYALSITYNLKIRGIGENCSL